MERTLIGETPKLIGQEVKLEGFVDSVRVHGKLIFIDIRDRSGLVQAVVNKEKSEEAFLVAKKLTAESSVEITGMVEKRPDELINTKIQTGMVEVAVGKITIYSLSKSLPFPIDSDGLDIDEELRLKYRYLDLRRKRLVDNIRFRSKFVQLVRDYLFKNDFCEIETPLLSKSTPEGSRDFIVPSRLQPGKFYALPQSPQQYKQLLMVAGFERYFQIARCLRDEDLRADRGFEHTQIDLEMSFVKREDVMSMVEGMVTFVVEATGGKILKKPFPVFTYDEAMKKYGADKFDMRSEEEIKAGINAFAWVVDFPFFEKDKEGNWTFTHNPFSDPVPQHKRKFLDGEIESIKTTQYDLVWNGTEAGGGSIRSHEPEVLKRVFQVMGYKDDKIQEQFGHMLEAFTYGVPPHGGIALGIDRLVMLLCGEKSLKEVVAFPTNSKGKTAVMDAPSVVDDIQLQELALKVVNNTNKPLYSQIIEILDKKGVKYKKYEHIAVSTSEEAAKVRNTKMSQGAKALIMLADKKPLMLVLPANLKADFKKLKKALGIRNLEMAKAEQVKSISSVEIGAVPPFGNLMAIPVYVDEHLKDEKEIVFNAGLHTKSILMGYADFEEIVKPVPGDFTS